MANTIFKLRRSSVPDKRPNTSTLAIGELAINITDRKLFSTDGVNVWEVASNVSVIQGANSITTGYLYANHAYSDHVTVNNEIITQSIDIRGSLKAANSYGNSGLFLTSNGSAAYWANPSATIEIPYVNQSETGNGVKTNFSVTGGYDADRLNVFVNGIRMTDAEANVASGANVVFATAPVNGSKIEFIGYILDGSDGSHVKINYTGDGTTNNFTVTGNYDADYLNVYLNGVRMSNTEVNTTSGVTVAFYTPPSNGVNIDIVGVKNLNPLATYVVDEFTADGTTTTFNSTLPFNGNKLQVYLNGVKMSSAEANTATGTTIVFSSPPANGSVIETYGIYTPVAVSVANADVAYVWTNTHTFTNTVSLSSVSANGSLGSLGQVLLSNGSAIYWGSNPAASGANTDAQFIWTNTHTFTNTVTFSQTINGTANSSLFIGSLPAANVVSNAQLSGNLSSYQTTAGLSANVATLTSNNVSFVGSVDAANVVSNAQLSGNLANYVNTTHLSTNLANYQTTAGLSANVAVLTANAAAYLGSAAAASYVQNTDSRTLSGNLVLSGANTQIIGVTRFGNGGWAKGGSSNGDLLLDNGASDTPGVLFYYANNKNFGIDSESNKLRFVADLNEAGGAVKASLDTSGNFYTAGYLDPQKWKAGQVINDVMLSNSEITILSTTIANTGTSSNFITYNYTPLSNSSYLIVHLHISKYTMAGTTDDSWFSQLLVDGSEICYGWQMVNDNGTGTSGRSGVLFPLTGRFTNSNTAVKQIQVAARRDSADDSVSIDNSSTSIWLRITEVAR